MKNEEQENINNLNQEFNNKDENLEKEETEKKEDVPKKEASENIVEKSEEISIENNMAESNTESNIESNLEENVENKKDNKIIEKIKNIAFHVIAIICIAIFCSAVSPKTLQNDTFYTIPIGQYICNNGVSNLTTDIFSWHELPYSYPHWLYDLLMYLIYNSYGQQGIYISTMVFASILGISIYCLSHKKSKNKVVSLVISIGAVYLMRSFIAARAQLLTFILFVWTVYFIENFLEKGKIRYAIPLVIIPLLIANLHCAVFPFYFILFLPYIGEYVLTNFVDFDIDLRIFSRALKIVKKFTKK